MAPDSRKSIIRILMVNRGVFRVPPESSGGGAEKHGYYLANSLADLGHSVDFISKVRHGSLFHSQVKVHTVPPRRSIIPPKTSFTGWTFKHLFANILSIITALRLLQRENFRFDVIHCHSALTALVLSILTGKRIPVVYTMHDSSPWIASYRSRLERWIRKAVFVGVEVPCLRRMDSIVAVSPALVTEALRWRANRGRVKFIPNGIEPNGPQPSRRESLKGHAKEPLGLFVGQLVSRKGLDVLVEAIPKLRDSKARFLIVGDGPERERLLRQSRSEGISDRVHFAGYVEKEALDDYYEQASFFVFPSLAESFGLALFEAMSHGLPTIASDLKAYDGILNDRKNTLLFEPGNSTDLASRLDELLQNPDLHATLSKNGSTLVKQRFNWPETATRVADIYSELVSMKQQTPKNLQFDVGDDSQRSISQIATEIAATIPAESIYLVGSRAQHLEYGNDYDILLVMKSVLVPLHLRKIKKIGNELSAQLSCKVDVNPLTTLRLRRAKGNLFLMKNRTTALLLWGQPLFERMDVGDASAIAIDWYFSYYFFLLKELLAIPDPKSRRQTEPIVRKIGEGLAYLTTIAPAGIAKATSDCAKTIRAVSHEDMDWFGARDLMLALFTNLMETALQSKSSDFMSQVNALIRWPKGKSFLKNFEYSLLLLLRRDIVSPARVLSPRLIMDRYRATLILLAAAVSRNGIDNDLTSKAYGTLRGCMSLKKSQDLDDTWNDLRSAVLQNWDIAQSLMGL